MPNCTDMSIHIESVPLSESFPAILNIAHNAFSMSKSAVYNYGLPTQAPLLLKGLDPPLEEALRGTPLGFEIVVTFLTTV